MSACSRFPYRGEPRLAKSLPTRFTVSTDDGVARARRVEDAGRSSLQPVGRPGYTASHLAELALEAALRLPTDVKKLAIDEAPHDSKVTSVAAGGDHV